MRIFRLLAEPELLDELLVPFDVFLLHIGQEPLALADELFGGDRFLTIIR